MIRSSDPPSSGPSELYVKGASSGGGGAVTIADGADVVEGALADAAVITDAGGTLSGKLRGLVKWAFERMPTSLGQKLMTASFPVVIASDQSAIPVSGTITVNEPVTVDATDLDIRNLAFATDKVDVGGSSVSVSNFPATQPISAVTLPLPTGAATSALQLPDGHNVTVDNAAGAAAVNIQDGGNSLTVDGSVTANAGTNLNTSALALEAGGNLAAAAASLAILDDWDETDRAKVNPIVGQAGVQGASGVVTALTQRVVLATDVALPTGDNNIGNVDIVTMPNVTLAAGTNTNEVVGDVAHDLPIAGNPLTVGGVASAAAPADVSADQDAVRAWYLRNGAAAVVLTAAGALIGGDAANGVDADITRIATGSNLIGDVGIKPRTTGGLTTFHLVSAATTNATSIKASAGHLMGWYIYNSNAAARKVAFHNTAGTPTAGASVFFSIVIPPSSAANVFSEIGIAFSSGIGITTVTGLADSDNVAVAANDLIINLFYA